MSILAMLTGLILALAMVLGMAGEAYAASLRPSEQNLHIRFTHGISLPLGVIGLDTSNNHYYCMEAGAHHRLHGRPGAIAERRPECTPHGLDS